MPSVKATEFEEHLAKGKLLPVYALVGADDALVSDCVGRLKAAVERPDLPGSISRDAEDEADPRDIFDELRTQPFMGMAGMRLIILRQGAKFAAAHAEPLQEYLEAPSKWGVLALCCERIDGRTEAAKLIVRVGLVVDCERLDWRSAKGIAQTEARTRGKRLTAEAAQAIVDAVGPNLASLRQEIDKLVLYVGDEEAITDRHVEEVVPQGRARSIFELSDAIVQGNAAQALRTGEDLILKGERPEAMVAFLASQVRRTWQVKRMLSRRVKADQIARELSIPEFAVQRAMKAAQSRDEEWFTRRVEILAAADMELKTTAVQSREEPVWLIALLVRLCQ